MKFNHLFELIENGIGYRKYKSDNINARLDFISDKSLRVAIYKDDEYIIPTFNVAPDNKMSLKGRDRLSVEGFNVVEPIENENGFVLGCGVEISLDLNNFNLCFIKQGKRIFEDRKPLAYNFENEFGLGSFHYVSRDENEKIFGLGDKTGELNKSGKSD